MPRNGSGVYTLPKPAFVPNTTISSADVNSDFSDIATALTGSIAADGQTAITAPIKFPSGTFNDPSITFASDDTSGVFLAGASQVGVSGGGLGGILVDGTQVGAGGSILQYSTGAIITPIGALYAYAGSSAPSGWALAYGQAISRTDYPECFFWLGTTYGSGDGTTTFNLPDCRGRTLYGKDNMGGSTAGRITNALAGFVGTTLGAAGGAQSFTLGTSNLPAYTPSGTNASSSISATVTNQNTGVITNNGSGPLASAGGGTNWTISTLGITGTAAAQTFTGAAQGGSATPYGLVSPGIIVNIIIFLGRP